MGAGGGGGGLWRPAQLPRHSTAQLLGLSDQAREQWKSCELCSSILCCNSCAATAVLQANQMCDADGHL